MKKESSYQKMKRKYEKRIAEMAADLRILVKEESPFHACVEVKEKWRFRFQRSDAFMYGEQTSKSAGK